MSKKNSLFNKWCWQNQSYMEKNQTGLLSHILHKNKFKID